MTDINGPYCLDFHPPCKLQLDCQIDSYIMFLFHHPTHQLQSVTYARAFTLSLCKYFSGPVLDFQMPSRLENLEKSLVILSTQLQQQQLANNDLRAALALQQGRRVSEKTAFVNAIGVLQGAVTQLAYQVDKIPRLIEKDKQNRYKDYVASKINNMSEKIGKLSSRLDRDGTKEMTTRDTGSRCIGSRVNCRSDTAVRSAEEPDATGALLSKLLGKDIQKALAGLSSDSKGKTETKDISPSVAQPQSVSAPVMPSNVQTLTPIDLLPQSHVTSLSTPTGQGPAGSVSTNPVQPNFSFVQVPSQTNIAAPSTPTGSGPVGSVSTMTPGAVVPEQAKTVSLTSFASKFKPPVNLAGYNVLPLVPVAPVQAQQPLEAPGIISPQPAFQSLTDAAVPLPGASNPYEVLTSTQMQPNVVQPLAFNGGAPLPIATQEGNPYEVLTTSQMGAGGYPVSKGKVTENSKPGKKEKIKKQSKGTSNVINGSGRHGKLMKGEIKKGKRITVKKQRKNTQTKNGSRGKKLEDLNKDPLARDLVEALKLGNLKKDELSNSRQGSNKNIST